MFARRQLKIVLSFVLFGVALGLVENLIAISFATSHALDLRAVLASLLVVIPFAAIGELIVDRQPLIPHAHGFFKHLEVFLEFFVFGVVMGVVEDLIVITVLTGQPFSWQVVGVVFLVTLPFAAIGEIIVDRHDWFAWLRAHTPIR